MRVPIPLPAQMNGESDGLLARQPATTAASPAFASPHSALSASPRQLQQRRQIAQLQSSVQESGGLPAGLRQGIESLSGLDMSGVRVHHNSSKPAALQAHAYAQGQDIHLGPGQEKHLPHEAWHLVQQAQGRVRPTLQMAGATPVNDDAQLEREADLMGNRAQRQGKAGVGQFDSRETPHARPRAELGTAQRAEIASKGGVFRDKDFQITSNPSNTPGSKGQTIGATIDLSFLPSSALGPCRIGLVQSVKSLETTMKGGPTTANPLRKYIAAADIEIDGPKSDLMSAYANDRLFSNSPVYGALQEPASGNLAEVPQPEGSRNKIGSVADNGQVTPATLWDHPKRPTDSIHAFSIRFETAALGLSGSQADAYLGSVSWGLSWTAGKGEGKGEGTDEGEARLEPLRLASRGAPTESFYRAARAWNAGQVKAMFAPAKRVGTSSSSSSSSIREEDAPGGISKEILADIRKRMAAAAAGCNLVGRRPGPTNLSTIKLPVLGTDPRSSAAYLSLHEQTQRFLQGVMAATTIPTFDVIHALMDRWDQLHVPADAPMREGLQQLHDLLTLHGGPISATTTGPIGPPSMEEVQARELGLI